MKTVSTLMKTIAVAAIVLLANISNAQNRRVDSAALVALYNATGGASWTNHTNWLTGPIDAWFGVTVANSRVTAVNLSNNNLAGGPIPRGIVIDSALQVLDLSSNAITGAFPAISDTSLLTLNLANNQLAGAFNGYNYSMANLQTLSLSGNQLNGTIASVSKFNKLVTLNIANNQFTGTIPYFSDTLLTTLNLSNNQLTGTINYWALKNLQHLDLSNNQLTGGGGALASFANIVSINVSDNQFSGTAPYFGGKAFLVSLDLSHNAFTGNMPYFTNVSLQTVNLSYNQFSGIIGYYNTPALVNFYADHNQLTGGINMYKPATLKVLALNANLLGGTITNNFNGMGTLLLDSNNFTFNGIQTLAADTIATFTYGHQDTVLPLHYITYSQDKLSVTAGGNVAKQTFSWYKDGLLIAKIIGDSTYKPTGTGIYYVQVTDSVAKLLMLTSALYNVSVLPVTFTSFSATLTSNSGANLKWQTTTETNNKYFEVERSLDGIVFTTIGTVASISGTSTSVKDYAYTDDVTSFTGTVYYRLKQVDADGKSQFSKIVTVIVSKLSRAAVSVYPNPVKTVATIKISSLQARQVSVRVVNTNGAVVYHIGKANLQQGDNTIPVNLSAFASGTYTIEIAGTSDKSIDYKKIIKY
ncbi:T9SS type A sorting domain-containing protein [Parasediminibacterium sp. JCM 36343]|uniref:T9SS type A sorting domain-containing protein n=1 Tax=Parasediminibacterium sp. JCM 36343 TaxID=3374279 RepID=UPI0039790EC8